VVTVIAVVMAASALSSPLFCYCLKHAQRKVMSLPKQSGKATCL